MTRNYTIVGEPAIQYSKYRSISAQKDLFTEIYSSTVLESDNPEFPVKIAIEQSHQQSIASIKIARATANLDGKGPQYSKDEPCKFEK